MEIHRPKPWHGWREFLREYAIIFVGVLTALSFEQAAEWLHRRAEVDEVRHAVRSEIAANAAIATGIVAQERCLSAVADRINVWANGGPGLGGAPQRSPSIWSQRTTTWEVVRGGAAARMPLDELLAYAKFYELIEADRVRANLEIELWQDVLQVAGQSAASGSLSPSEARRLSGLANRLRLVGTIRERNARDLLAQATRIGVRTAPMSPMQREDLRITCGIAGIPTGL